MMTIAGDRPPRYGGNDVSPSVGQDRLILTRSGAGAPELQKGSEARANDITDAVKSLTPDPNPMNFYQQQFPLIVRHIRVRGEISLQASDNLRQNLVAVSYL